MFYMNVRWDKVFHSFMTLSDENLSPAIECANRLRSTSTKQRRCLDSCSP